MSQHAFGPRNVDDLQQELSFYQEDGIQLKLNGYPSDASAIANACRVAEDGTYMRDYIENEKGEWIELDFDWVMDQESI